jgi:phenylacetate-coenzyme A ligase PaaK-like adenylate-forming protein
VTERAFTPFAPLRDRVQAELMRRLPDHIARLGWSPEQIAARQRDGLRRLLAHAREHSPFHARRLRGVDVERFEPRALAGLPWMTKAELMDEFDDVVTDRRLDRALAEQAIAATKDEPQPLFGEYVCLSSGGSSGRRGIYVQSVESTIEFLSSLNRTRMRSAMLDGGLPPGGITMAMVGAACAIHATGAGPAWTAGFPARFVAVPATSPLSEIVDRLNALQPDGLYGYPSALARLAREQREGRLRVKPKSVTCTSENLLPAWRAEISAAFGAPVVNVFGSTEGLVGISEPDEVALSFNTDVCIVELVDGAGAPVPPGTPSARILVTNLANHAQPLVRYEMTDCFIQQPAAPDHGHLRARVEGRAGTVLRWGDVEVHALAIGTVLARAAAVQDYRVRQTRCGVDVDVVADENVEVARLRSDLAAGLEAAGLRQPEVHVRCVAALERHPETGKVRRFVSL